IAQSDSEYDQSVKLAVRDEVLAAVRKISARDTAAFEKAAEAAALEYLEKNNVPYSARVCSGTFAFPEKQYENITLPAGEYFGIRIILGSGKGHNWWCVMYPPLCVDGNTAYAPEDAISELDAVLRPGTRELVLGSGKRVRFRILELLSH
ncbi:MAG: stage II sporulation protein R, partial [Clostridia bacterium]|nr:stage II sporulation protein R [Clostridia bacterium]